MNTKPSASRPRRLAAAALTVGAALAAVPARVAAQAPQLGGGAGISWESYGFGTPAAANIERLSLLTIPFSGNVSLGGDATVSIRGGFAEASLTRADGTAQSLAGPTDTELRFTYRVGDPAGVRFSLGALALLPTGNATHSLAEAEVAGAIASELLPFRIHHWGSGGGAGPALGATGPLGRGSLGASVSYLFAREFEPLDVGGATPFVYRPGNQLQVRASLSQPVGDGGRMSIALTFQQHDEDAHAGRNLYQAGNRYHAMGSYAFRSGARSDAILYLGGLHRDGGTALEERVQGAPAQDLILAGAGLRAALGGGFLLPSMDARIHRSEDGVGQGYLVGVGSSLEWPAGAVTLIPGARLRAGNLVVRSGEETSLLGFDLSLSARFGGR
jgi:hypothetical protein